MMPTKSKKLAKSTEGKRRKDSRSRQAVTFTFGSKSTGPNEGRAHQNLEDKRRELRRSREAQAHERTFSDRLSEAQAMQGDE